MNTQEEIYSRVLVVLEQLFKIDTAEVVPASNLYQDLDIDSIDAVDLVVELKKITGKKITPDDFKSVRTIQDVVDAVHKLVNGS